MNGVERWSASVILAVLASASTSRADPAPAPAGNDLAAERSTTDEAGAAQALFVEGKRLAAEGKYPEACSKFEQSFRLDKAAGTQVNLADCYERSGRLASAWIGFHDAAVLAEHTGRAPWSRQARERARILEPRVPTLAVAVAETSAQLEVRREGVLLEPSTFGAPVPVDPGQYTIVAVAPKRAPWTTRVSLDAGSHVLIQIPVLREERAPAASESSFVSSLPVHEAPAPRAAGTLQRTVALGVAAVSVVPLAIGSYLGVLTINRNDQALALCPMSPKCTNPRAIELTDEAHRAATGSTIAFVTAGVLLAASGGLLLTAPKGHSLAVHVGLLSAAVVDRW